MTGHEPGPAASPLVEAESRSSGLPRQGLRSWKSRGLLAVLILAALGFSGALLPQGLDLARRELGLAKAAEVRRDAPAAKASKDGAYRPTDTQWQTLDVETVAEMPFRTILAMDGKIAIDEDHTTPVFSPYAGRILKLFAKPGEHVGQGSPLFLIEASDMVQGQNDFVAAKASLNKARSQLQVAEVILKRHRELVAANAISRRELEQAEIGQVAATNDLKAAEVAYEAARNRLRILGKSDGEIDAFEQGGGRISAETVVMAPLSGTVVQRKVGPGQYVTGASNDPVFLIGDLSTVWLVANVRETDATKIDVGQPLEFSILAEPGKVFSSRIDYVSSSVSPETRRLQVRAEIANPQGVLRPEMFASVAISIRGEQVSPGVPRSAVIYEGDAAHVWLVRADRSIERRKIAPGTSWGGFQQVVSGLSAGDKIVGRGSLFIDRLAGPATDAD